MSTGDTRQFHDRILCQLYHRRILCHLSKWGENLLSPRLLPATSPTRALQGRSCCGKQPEVCRSRKQCALPVRLRCRLGHEGGDFNGSCRSFTVLVFNHYSGRVIFPCDGSFMVSEDLGQLQVLIPPNSTGGYDLENVTIQSIPTEQLNTWHCPAMASRTTRLNSGPRNE
jgi:hypothetical protein